MANASAIAARNFGGTGRNHHRNRCRSAQPDRRKVRINGANASINNLAEWLSGDLAYASMDRLSSMVQVRAGVLDRLVLALEPGHARHASRYEKAVQQSNRILATHAAPDPFWLDAM